MAFKNIVPNIVSLTRIPLGVLVFIFCSQGKWYAAFCCMVVGFMTDGLDGYLAYKLNAQSAKGARIDSLSDSALGIGVYTGLLVSGAVATEPMIALAFYGLITWLIANLGNKTSRVRVFFEGFNSFVAIFAGISAIIVFLVQINQPIMWVVVGIIAAFTAVILIPLKQERLSFWWKQMNGSEKKSQF